MISGRPITEDLHMEPDFLSMATKLGAIYRLPKPFKLAALLSMATQCLESDAQPWPDRDVASNR